MVNVKENELINNQLDELYEKYTAEFLKEWQKAFQDAPPFRINEFGIINEQKYDVEKGILFICRETNGWEDEDYSNGVLFRSWMADISEKGLQGETHIKQHPNMWYNIGRWILLINSPETPIENIASLRKEALKYIGQVAFTNINKVRGENASKEKYHKLTKAPVVGEVLKQEIEIIKPEIIVCCGTGGIFDKYIKNYGGKVIYMKHPGARVKKVKMLEELKEQL